MSSSYTTIASAALTLDSGFTSLSNNQTITNTLPASLNGDGTISLISAVLAPSGEGVMLDNSGTIALLGTVNYTGAANFFTETVGQYSTLQSPQLYGVNLLGPADALKNSGIILGQAELLLQYGVTYNQFTNNGTRLKLADGVHVVGGSLFNSGYIGGVGAGVSISGTEIVTNQGQIVGLTPGTILATESFTGPSGGSSFAETLGGYAGSGLFLDAGAPGVWDSVNNSGSITGQTAIYVYGGSALINNTGLILGGSGGYTFGYGIRQQGTYSGLAGNIAPGSYGTLSIVNSGIIAGPLVTAFSNASGEGVYLLQGEISNSSIGLITAYNEAVRGYVNPYNPTPSVTAAVSLYNQGSIIATGSTGVGVNLSNGSVQNNGLISAAGTDGIGLAFVRSTFAFAQNSGTIFGGADGISFNSNGTLLNSAAISGGSIGAYMNLAYLGNSGSISGQTGVLLGGDATLSNSTSGTITGNVGVETGLGGDIIVNAGQIGNADSETGLSIFSQHNTIINSGTIEALAQGSLSPGVNNVGLGAGVVFSETYGAQLINQSGGTIVGLFSGVAGQDYATIQNDGVITGLASTGITLTTGFVNNDGLVQGGTGQAAIAFTDGGVVEDFLGSIIGGIDFGTGASALVLTAYSSLSGSVAASGGLTLYADTSGEGEINLGGSIAGITAITLAAIGEGPGAQSLPGTFALAGTSAELAAGQTITGFGANETLIIENFSDTAATYASGAGLELGADTLDIVGSFATSDFAVSTDGTNTTISAVPCFCAGTLIRTTSGERPVEELRIGDVLETLHGGPRAIRWIGTRAYEGHLLTGNHLMLPVTVKPGALGLNNPARALHLSPGHALLVEGHLIPAWRLVNGVSVTQAAQVMRARYFHIELDTHEIIFAESCPAESFHDEACRAQFHNAASAPPGPACTPLPRCESGFALEAVRAFVAGRAKLRLVPPGTGLLRGFVDVAGPECVAGWAQDESTPESPVALDIKLDGVRVARILANEYRADLREAGIGTGCHGFSFSLPRPGLAQVSRAADGAVLALTETAQAA